MKSALGPLVRTELRRLLTPVGIALPFLFLALTTVVSVLEAQQWSIAPLPTSLFGLIGNFLIPITLPLIAVGMVASDVKDHWLRTLLMRPVSRADYLVARMTAVFLMMFATCLIAGLLPILVVPAVLGKPIVWMVSRSVPTMFFIIAHGYLILVLLTMLSCWVPGIANIVLLAVWALGSASIGSLVRFKYWDEGWIVVASEFLFPSGFIDAARMAAYYEGDPMTAALWGVAAAIAATAVTFWSVNRVQVDGGSE